MFGGSPFGWPFFGQGYAGTTTTLAVVHVGGNVTTGTSPTVSDSWASTSGSLIAVIGQYFGTSGTAANGDVTDSKSNVYTLVTSSLGGAGVCGIALYYNNAGTRGASHTVTLTGPSPSFVNVAVIEITGQDAATPLDSTTFATASDTTAPYAVTSAAAISGNQIALYGCVLDTGSTNTWSQPGGYTNIINQGNGSSFLVTDAAYKINETGTPAPAASWGTTGISAREVFATFKEAATGSGSGFRMPRIFVSREASRRSSRW